MSSRNLCEIIFLCHYFLPYSYICLLFFFLEKGLSLLGYHLCNFTVTKYVDKVVAYRKSYEEQTPCGGWIPWRQCTKTFYKEEYHPITISESVNLTDCCTGYEQVGLYCSLPLNRSSEFASRPGACPEKAVEALDISCMFDLDCPEHKKCCETSKGIGCSNPVPEGTGNLTKHWYNVSVLVKMDFYELSKVDPRLLSHYRLLHSMTMQAEPYMETVVSQVLVGLQEFVPLVNISLLLKDIVMRVSEVIDIVVQGYYFKYLSHYFYFGIFLTDLLPIRNHIICSITNSSFEMSWNVNSMQNHSFQVEVYKDKKLIQIIETMDMKLEVSNLETGVMYTAKVSYEVCSKQILSYKNVRTDALIFGVTLRILNYNFTSQLLNTSSAEYEAFSIIVLSFVLQIRNSFSSSISALYKKGILKMHVHSLEAGSIIVRLKIVIGDLQFPRDLSAFDPMMSSLSQSHVFLLDPKNSVVEDWNECASRAENDCYMFAECINTIGSYICRCKTTTDANPLRPGRNCEGKKQAFCCHTSIETVFIFRPSHPEGGSGRITLYTYKANIQCHTHRTGQRQTQRPSIVMALPHSNVVNYTSFHIAWTTSFPLNSAFQFSVFEGKHLLRDVKIQSSNMTFSRLNPGILYTVKIQVEVCGKKSKTIQRKVKTAAQKFNGTVKISNMNYRPELSNSSSEEFKNLTQLFLTEIRTSLPHNTLQKMDAGIIKMLIMNISNGSIVINFGLLIPTDMDANNVTWSFLDALQNNLYLRVDNNSLSIHGKLCMSVHNEETDCSPDASCVYLRDGSYECNCKEGFINVNAARPGRICEGNILGLENASTSTTVNKAITEPIVKVHNSPQTSSMPFATFSIKNEVHVFCELENFFITIRKDFLQKQSIPESSLYLGRPHCNVSQSNSSHVMLQAGWNECGTDVQSNTTHIIVKTILQNDMSSLGAIHLLKVASPIHCVFPNDLLTSTGYTSEGVYTIFEDLHGSGHFLTEMQLFIGNSPIPRNFSISASDNIMIEVGIQIEDSKLKVVVGKCWATPTNNSMDHLSFPFIHDSCPVPNAHTTMISNGISRKAQFKMKIFSFVNDSVVYLHCKIHVCVETPGTTCKTSCSGFRSQRSGETIAMPRTSWGPLRRSSEDKVPGLGTGYIILIVLGIFVLALGTIGFLVGRHLQKAGTYNFKIKSDYFNYQVFCD
uniref:Uromodulin like 1 n=1 Tax=Anolis carolinensis TaxID=28377 RepID=G1KBK7_ANOCA